MLQRLVAGFCKIGGVQGATLLDAQGFHVVGFANVVDFVQDTDNAAVNNDDRYNPALREVIKLL